MKEEDAKKRVCPLMAAWGILYCHGELCMLWVAESELKHGYCVLREGLKSVAYGE